MHPQEQQNHILIIPGNDNNNKLKWQHDEHFSQNLRGGVYSGLLSLTLPGGLTNNPNILKEKFPKFQILIRNIC